MGAALPAFLKRYWVLLIACAFLLLCAALFLWPKELKEWQTLVSAVLALGAASLVYRASMAKVELDREQAGRDLKRRQIGILIKVDFACRDLHDDARMLSAQMSFLPVGEHANTTTVEELRLIEPPEFEEAWQHLDVFPALCIQELRNIRGAVRQLSKHLNVIQSSSPWTITEHTATLPPGRETINALADEIWQSCAVLQTELQAAISELAPRIGENERMVAIYGEPSDDE
jgi:hypothetical protein